MATLKELIESNLAALEADDNARVVFLKEGEEWKSYFFTVFSDNCLLEEDKAMLFDIRDADALAVVMDIYDFRIFGKNVSKPLESMVSALEIIHERPACRNNINVFLEGLNLTYQHKPAMGSDSYNTSNHQQHNTNNTTLKFNKDEFWMSNLGIRLNNHVVNLFFALKYTQKVPSTSIATVSTVLTALNQCYGVQYNISVNENRYGIVSEDGADWLYTYEG